MRPDVPTPPTAGATPRPPAKGNPVPTKSTWKSPTGATYPAKIYRVGEKQFLFPDYYLDNADTGERWILDRGTIRTQSGGGLVQGFATYFNEKKPTFRQQLTGVLVGQ